MRGQSNSSERQVHLWEWTVPHRNTKCSRFLLKLLSTFSPLPLLSLSSSPRLGKPLSQILEQMLLQKGCLVGTSPCDFSGRKLSSLPELSGSESQLHGGASVLLDGLAHSLQIALSC